MVIKCPTCGKEVSAQDVNVATSIAKCSDCNSIFNFSGQLPVSFNQDSKPRNIIAPKSCVVERGPDGLTIVRSWFSPQIIFLTIFCLFWNGFMAVWFTIAFTKKIYIMALFGSIHGAVGLGLLYGVLAGYFNKTYIMIKQNLLTIAHKPFPGAKQIKLTKSDIKQLYTKEEYHHHKHGHSHTYSVYALIQNGQHIKLLDNLPDSQQALFMEQEIEKYLRIEDMPVRGELSR